MRDLFNTKQNSDFKFKIEGKYIFVHKNILKTNCIYLQKYVFRELDRK